MFFFTLERSNVETSHPVPVPQIRLMILALYKFVCKYVRRLLCVLLFNVFVRNRYCMTELHCTRCFVVDKLIKELNARLAESEAQVSSVIQVCFVTDSHLCSLLVSRALKTNGCHL